MTDDLFQFFAIQRNIFGLCACCDQFFRLSDCRIYLRIKPKKDWMDLTEAEDDRLDRLEEKIEAREKDLREKARAKGRHLAQRAIRKIDPIFAPRRLNPDDAKVLFHPVDYVVFNGMKNLGPMKGIIFLDRETASRDRRPLQRSIEKAVEAGKYEWITIRVQEDGTIREER